MPTRGPRDSTGGRRECGDGVDATARVVPGRLARDAARLGPAPALFQYATHDDFVAVASAKHYFDISSGPKEVEFYESSHALNANALRDRIDYLRRHLSLSEMAAEVLEKIPETK